MPPELVARLSVSLVPGDEIARRRLEVLAWLVWEGRLGLRAVVAVDGAGVPLPGPYFPRESRGAA